MRGRGVPFELLIASGNNPTNQRNHCIEKSTYSHLWFLDNDSILTAEVVSALLNFYEKEPNFAIVGGPSLNPKEATDFPMAAELVLSSPFAIGNFSNRYEKRGKIRPTNDSELILCNLIVSKATFNAIGLFNDKLYPNEENEFIARALANNLTVWHNPDIFVLRTQRETLNAFVKQILTYGQGRGEQTKIAPNSFLFYLIVPLAFSVYMPLYFIFSLVRIFFSHIEPVQQIYLVASVLPAIYAMGLMTFFFYNLLKKSCSGKRTIVSVFLLILCHLLYGWGFFKAIFSKSFRCENRKEIFSFEKIEGTHFHI